MENSFKKGDGVSRGCFEGLLRVAFNGNVPEKISTLPQVQKEVFYYLHSESMNSVQIAKLRNTTPQGVRNIINKLRDKGIINKLNRLNLDVAGGVAQNNSNMGGSSVVHPVASSKKYRLHGQCMTIKILKSSRAYWKILDKQTQYKTDNNTIQLFRRKLVIYSNQSFYSEDVDECFINSDEYWTRFLRKLENDLSLVLVNGKYTEIKQFRCHIADTENILAKKVVKNNLTYNVLDDLGRLRLIIDNSKNLFEFEAVDNRLCQDDLKTIGELDRDIINLKERFDIEPKMSEIYSFMSKSAPILKNIPEMESKVSELVTMMNQIDEYSENIKLHMEVQREQLKTQKQIQELLGKIKND